MIWKPVVGCEFYYEVSSCGKVRRKGKLKCLAYRQNKKSGQKHLRVKLSVLGIKRLIFVHRLVADAFIGKRPNEMDTNHIDGDPTNNHVSNLEYVTRSQNMKHKSRVLNRGVISEKIISEIKLLLAKGLSQGEIGRRLKVSQSAVVGKIANGTHWSCDRTYK